MLESSLFDFVFNYILLLERLPTEAGLLIRQHEFSKVATSHLATLEESAGQSTLIHFNQLHKVLKCQLLSLNHLFVLRQQASHLEEI